MFGMGSGEMLVIGVVALIVIGPKDLPGMFRTMGQYTGKARAMAREFSKAMDQAANQSGVNDISKSIKAATNPTKFGLDKLRDATKLDSASPAKPAAGAAMTELTKERAEFKAKMDAKAAEIRAAKSAAAEAASDAAEHAETSLSADAPKPAVPKPAARKSAAPKPVAPKPVAKAAKAMAADAPKATAPKPRARKSTKPEAGK